MSSEATTTRVNERERDMEKKLTQPAALEEQPQFRNNKVQIAKTAQFSYERKNYERESSGKLANSKNDAINGVRLGAAERGSQPIAQSKPAMAVSINAAQDEDDLTDSEEDRFFSVRGSSYLRQANDEALKNLSGGSEEGSLCCSDEDDLETVRKYEVTVSHSRHLNNNKQSTYHLNANSSILGPQSIQLQLKDQTSSKESKNARSRENIINRNLEGENVDIYIQKTALNHPQSPMPVRNHHKPQLRTMLTTINDQRQPKLQSQLSEVSKNTKTSTSQKSSDQQSAKPLKKNQANQHEIESSRSISSQKKTKSQKQTELQSNNNFEEQDMDKDRQTSGRGVTRLHREPSSKIQSKNSIQDGSNNVNDSLQNSSSSSSSNDKTEDGDSKLPQIRKHSIKKKRDRVDIYGHPIKRGGKKHKVVFADHKQLGKPLYLIHEVESFKRYNTDMSARGSNKACCSIF